MQCSTFLYTCLFLTTIFAKNLIVETVTSENATQHGISSGCILPQQPTGGRYQLDTCMGNSCNDQPGSRVPSGSFIKYSCYDGYVLMGEPYSACRIDTLYNPPTCVKVCHALRSVSVDFTCRHHGAGVSCESKIFPGTKATLTCKSFYHIPFVHDPGYREITCLDDGTWDRTVFNCIAECGIETAQVRSMTMNGFQATYIRYSWHVGIYKRSGVDFEQICGGTLVSPNLVVSAAHCFWDERFTVVENATEFAVAVGKFYRPYNMAERYVQKSKVKKIGMEERYSGYRGNYAHDIALLTLETPFVLSTMIRPICMNCNTGDTPELESGMQGKVVGWGKTETGNPSAVLREINLPYVPYNDCFNVVPEDLKGFITADKFCAGYFNNGLGSSVCDGDSGGGLYFKFGNLWYLRGIVSVSPTSHGSCDNNHYSAFTDVTHFREWIRNVYFNSSIFSEQDDTAIIQTTRSTPVVRVSATAIPKSGCILPEQPAHEGFQLGSCGGQCIVVPGSRVPIGSLLTYTCDQGYTLVENNVSVCYDNVWFLPPTDCVKKYCPALSVAGVNFDCKLQGENVSCEIAIAPGTKATLACKYFYEFSPGNDPGYREITCLENGTWDRVVVECVPAECGRAVPDGTQVVVDGSKISPLGFPWHVHVYYRENSTAPFLILIVATLISPNLVLSDTWSLVEYPTIIVKAGKFAVTAGNYHNPYGTWEPYAQKSLVSRIIVEEGSHERALLYLETFFEVTAFVRPICMDWYGRVEEELMENRKTDKVVVWHGLTLTSGNKTPKTALSYIPFEECRSRVPEQFTPFVTTDSFCVDCSNGESEACDTTTLVPGVGYEFHGVWYLLGSIKVGLIDPPNNGSLVLVYFRVGNHSDWIRRDWIRNFEY